MGLEKKGLGKGQRDGSVGMEKPGRHWDKEGRKRSTGREKNPSGVISSHSEKISLMTQSFFFWFSVE